VKIGKYILDNPYERPDFIDEGFDYFVNAFGYAADGTFYHCPCCWYPTLSMRGSFEVCRVCYWEDDGQDNHDADRVRGGPNEDFSLTQARANFAEYGVYDAVRLSNVRPPTDEEIRNRNNDL
jgi:Cysteine-rich CPCC